MLRYLFTPRMTKARTLDVLRRFVRSWWTMFLPMVIIEALEVAILAVAYVPEEALVPSEILRDRP